MHGLESCINVTEYEKNAMWATLSSTDRRTNSNHVGPMADLRNTLSAMVLRAKANSQRHYEIYSIHVDNGITKDDIVDMFETNPQGMADLIRERGNKIHSDRIDKRQQVIV